MKSYFNRKALAKAAVVGTTSAVALSAIIGIQGGSPMLSLAVAVPLTLGYYFGYATGSDDARATRSEPEIDQTSIAARNPDLNP